MAREVSRCRRARRNDPPAAAPRRASFTHEGTHVEAFEAKDWIQLCGAGAVWGESVLLGGAWLVSRSDAR
jgi:hypothetical protein